jgi:hypothetical protein
MVVPCLEVRIEPAAGAGPHQWQLTFNMIGPIVLAALARTLPCFVPEKTGNGNKSGPQRGVMEANVSAKRDGRIGGEACQPPASGAVNWKIGGSKQKVRCRRLPLACELVWLVGSRILCPVQHIFTGIVGDHDLPTSRRIAEQLRNFDSVVGGFLFGIDWPESLAFAIDPPRAATLDDDV